MQAHSVITPYTRGFRRRFSSFREYVVETTGDLGDDITFFAVIAFAIFGVFVWIRNFYQSFSRRFHVDSHEDGDLYPFISQGIHCKRGDVRRLIILLADFKFTTGAHIGKTFKEVYAIDTDKSYVTFCGTVGKKVATCFRAYAVYALLRVEFDHIKQT